MKISQNTWANICLGAVLTWIVFITVLVLWFAPQHKRVETDPPTWKPPVIEQCDQPIWDRIREGC